MSAVTLESLETLRRERIAGLPVSHISSWAVWDTPAPPSEPFVSNRERLAMPSMGDQLCAELRNDVVLLGLNPGNGVTRADWDMFHHADADKADQSHSERLAELSRNTGLWGAYMSDLIPLVVDSSSAVVADRLAHPHLIPAGESDSYDLAANRKAFTAALDMIAAPEHTIVVCMGSATYTWAPKVLGSDDDGRRFTICWIDHYSNAHRGFNAYAASERAQGYVEMARRRLLSQDLAPDVLRRLLEPTAR